MFTFTFETNLFLYIYFYFYLKPHHFEMLNNRDCFNFAISYYFFFLCITISVIIIMVSWHTWSGIGLELLEMLKSSIAANIYFIFIKVKMFSFQCFLFPCFRKESMVYLSDATDLIGITLRISYTVLFTRINFNYWE